MAYDRIGSYFANDWLGILIVFIAGTVYDVGIILIPFLQGLRIDWALAQKPFSDILYLTLGFLGTFLVRMVCRSVKKNETRRFSNKATDLIRNTIFKAAMAMPEWGDYVKTHIKRGYDAPYADGLFSKASAFVRRPRLGQEPAHHPLGRDFGEPGFGYRKAGHGALSKSLPGKDGHFHLPPLE